MPSNETTDVDRARPSHVARVDGEKELQRFLTMTDAEVNDLDPEDASVAIIAEVLAADTLDDLIGSRDTVSSKNYVGVPFTLTAVKFQRSTLDGEGPGFYAVLSGADADGQKVVITSGARQIMAQAWKMRDKGWLPADVQVGQSARPSAAGFFPQWLERAPAGF